MAKTLNDLIKDLDRLEVELLNEAPRITEEIALSTLALVINRIQKQGIPGASYSTKPMLATENMFNRKAAFKQSKKAYVRRDGKKTLRPMWIKFPRAKRAVPVMILPGGYKELRSLNGLQNAFIDLTFTGRMFQNTKILQGQQRGFKFLAIIGATNDENKKKMAGHAKRFGDFLAPTEKETAIVRPIPVNRIRAIIERVLG